VESLSPTHKAKCLNYLRATGLHTGLLINFGRPHLEIRRILG
jgi:GxxExxY protein